MSPPDLLGLGEGLAPYSPGIRISSRNYTKTTRAIQTKRLLLWHSDNSCHICWKKRRSDEGEALMMSGVPGGCLLRRCLPPLIDGRNSHVSDHNDQPIREVRDRSSDFAWIGSFCASLDGDDVQSCRRLDVSRGSLIIANQRYSVAAMPSVECVGSAALPSVR